MVSLNRCIYYITFQISMLEATSALLETFYPKYYYKTRKKTYNALLQRYNVGDYIIQLHDIHIIMMSKTFSFH